MSIFILLMIIFLFHYFTIFIFYTIYACHTILHGLSLARVDIPVIWKNWEATSDQGPPLTAQYNYEGLSVALFPAMVEALVTLPYPHGSTPRHSTPHHAKMVTCFIEGRTF